MSRFFILIFSIFTIFPGTYSKYDPTWESLDKRPLPSWYDDEKFGIFMHWGAYSATGRDAWIWLYWKGDQPDPDIVNFFNQNYPPTFTYADFAGLFKAELFYPSQFANIVKKAGAKYFVLTSRHHEGYTMWPSNYSWNWNSMDVGPHRDLVGDLANAMRGEGIRFGLYYSLFTFFHPLYLKDKANKFKTQEYVRDVMLPQMREIVNGYHPEVFWSDGDWDASYDYWNSTDFLAWLYNDSPVKDKIVTNDRWGVGTMCEHGDVFTCADRYSPGVLQKHKWENAMSIDRDAWGYRRNASYEDFIGIQELIEILAKTLSCGGNLLMNVGPTDYGKILPIFEERLTQMGEWLKINGEAVYGSKPWIYQNDTLTPNVWYTSKLRSTGAASPHRIYNSQDKQNTVVYAFVFQWPDNNQLELASPKPTSQTKITLLGYNATIGYKNLEPSGITVDLSTVQWTRLPSLWAWVLKLEYLETDSRVPYMV